MINSIKYFEENSIKRFEELENNFMKNPTQIAEYVMGLAEEGNRFLLRMIQETLESMNQMIIESPLRKKHWNIECYSEKQLTTSIGDLKDDIGMKRMDEAGEYILSNWMAARVRLLHQNGVKGCSAEGHVSHILSARMSSRPMGWSKKGATKMSQLRAYHLNGGNMLELVRYQEREMPKAAGDEYRIISAEEMLRAEKRRHGELGKYMETISHHVSLDTKKKVYFQSHLWGL